MTPVVPTAFIDEKTKLIKYETLRKCQTAGQCSECPGFTVFIECGMYEWMAASWTDLAASDRINAAHPLNVTGKNCGTVDSDICSLIASLVFQ